MNDRELMQQALDALDLVTDLTTHDDVLYEAIDALRARLTQPERVPANDTSEERVHKTGEKKHEPVAWLFQNEETGLTECVDTQQVEWGFEKNNPRWQKIAPLYTAPPQQPEPATLNSLHCSCGASWTFENGALRYESKTYTDVDEMFKDMGVQEPVAWMGFEAFTDEDGLISERKFLNTWDNGKGIPLYTAPPRREWQGLTDEEIEDACWTEVDQRLRSFARAIEAKLKEKNYDKR